MWFVLKCFSEPFLYPHILGFEKKILKDSFKIGKITYFYVRNKNTLKFIIFPTQKRDNFPNFEAIKCIIRCNKQG